MRWDLTGSLTLKEEGLLVELISLGGSECTSPLYHMVASNAWKGERTYFWDRENGTWMLD